MIENFIWRFLKRTLFGVGDLTLSYNFKTGEPILIMFCKISEKNPHATHFGRWGHYYYKRLCTALLLQPAQGKQATVSPARSPAFSSVALNRHLPASID